ncbi:response regulator transcription factor [Evansella clarkii]|uniref:response regulator transcription factor n=1 Tax=Evansella clarkii TaxID=79879 RepID=UPI0009973BA4|nr:response regulator transcription factor [Evansella clarkii]
MSGVKIILAEDDRGIRDLTTLYLTQKGYDVFSAEDGRKAIKLIEEIRPDLMLLDIMLPGMNGYEICEKVREITDAPVIFLSAKRHSADKVKGFESGGDDYMTKPYNMAELEARIKAHLRRNTRVAERKIKSSVLKYGELSVDTSSCEVYISGEKLILYAKELQLLLLLINHPNQVFSAEQIYDQIWGSDKFGDLKTVMVHISMLRKKIEKDPSRPEFIKTVRGFGYKFNAPSETIVQKI